MIIELFGPPAVGKTTLAHALAATLQKNGCEVQLIVSSRPAERTRAEAGNTKGFARGRAAIAAPLSRAAKLISAIPALLRGAGGGDTDALLVDLLPPRTLLWSVRYRRYLSALCHSWRMARDFHGVVIIDQGFATALCSLALLTSSADRRRIARALDLIPKPDLLIRLDAPREVLEARLRKRLGRQGLFERLFEFDLETSLRQIAITDEMTQMLQEQGQPVMHVDCLDLLESRVDRIMHEIQDHARNQDHSAGQGARSPIPAGVGAHRRSASARPCRRAPLQIREGACLTLLGQRVPCASGEMTRNLDVVSSAPAPGEPFRRSRSIAAQTKASGFAQVSGIVRAHMFAKFRSGQPLTRASIAAFIVFTVGAGLTYVAQVVTARVIGPDSYGVYAYVLAWVTLLAYFSTLGFHVSLLRFIPAYRAKEEFSLIRGVIRYSHLGAAGAAMSVVLIGLCVVLALDKSIRPELASAFLLGMAAVPFLALHLIGASAVRAFGGVVAALVPERIVRDGVLLAIIAAAFWSSFHALDATLAMAATLAGSAAMLGMVRLSLRRLRPKAGEGGTAVYTAKDWWRPTLPLTVIMVADNVMSRSGVIVLGLAGNTREAGIFAVAFSMAILTALPRMAVATVFAPAVSDLFTREDQAGLQSLTAKASWLSLLGTACVAIPLLALAQPLLAWFGPDFVAGAPIVGILIAGQVFAAACGPQQHLITMTAHERTGAAILAVCAAANLAACLLMISSFGMTGAALAMTATLITWNLAMGTFIYRRLRLKPGLVASLAPLRKTSRAQGYGV